MREILWCPKCEGLTSFIVNHDRAECSVCHEVRDYCALLRLWHAFQTIMEAERQQDEQEAARA
jgi:hypothetical protein